MASDNLEEKANRLRNHCEIQNVEVTTPMITGVSVKFTNEVPDFSSAVAIIHETLNQKPISKISNMSGEKDSQIIVLIEYSQ